MTSTEPIVHDDLDAWELEGRPEPYRFRHADRVWETRDPMNIGYAELQHAFALAMEGRPGPFLSIMIVDYDDFEQTGLSLAKMARTLERISKHYGLGTPGEASASPIS